ncbi:MAG: hypothetical protein ACRKGH_00795 [Dehalogenimonas sp.]
MSTWPDEHVNLPSGITSFKSDDPAIFFSTFMAAGCCEVAGVYWIYEDEILEFQPILKPDTIDYMAFAIFEMPRPESGFVPGKYKVIAFHGAADIGSVEFTVTK